MITILIFLYPQKDPLSNPNITVTVTPETATAQATSTRLVVPVSLTFTLTPQAALDISSAYLETVVPANISLTQIPLSKSADGIFVGTFTTPSAWLSPAQTVSFAVYVNDVKTSHVVRLAITDLHLTHPTHPGEAGKATLAGIDSNDDGIRDDLEREIVFMYPGNDLVRRILRAEMKATQEVLLSEGDHDYYVALLKKEFAFNNCYIYTQFGLNPADENGKILHNLVKNTPERKRVYEEHNKIALPFASDIHFNSEACTQTLVKGQY
ncbi:MAG: hypothetical protein ACYCZW_00875 [Minisyncoccota bacterium]